MAIATLSIDIEAKLASLEQGMTNATRIVEKNAGQMALAMEGVKGAFIGIGAALAAGLSIGAIVGFTREVINGLDALNDLKDATGASIENISALEDVALRTGTSFESLATTLVKFNKVLNEAGSKEDSGASRVLKALGLDAAELKKIDPAEALLQTAVAFQNFAADGDKARAAQVLFGKSIQEVAPFLKDLAEKGKLNATVTTEQAQAAEDFNKRLFSMKKNTIDAARAFASEFLPQLDKLFPATEQGAKGFNLITVGADVLRQVIKDTSSVVVTFSYLFENLSLRSKAFSESALALKNLDFSKGVSIGAQLDKDLDKAFTKMQDLKKLIRTPLPQVTAIASPDSRPSLKVPDAPDKEGKARKVIDKTETAYQRLINRIKERVTLTQAELDSETKLTEGQKFSIDVLSELEKSTLNYTAAQKANIKALLATPNAIAESIAQKELLIKTAKESLDASLAETSALYAIGVARSQENDALRLQTIEYGLTSEAIEQLRIKRLEDVKASEEQKLAFLSSEELQGRETEAIKTNIAELQKQINLRKGLAGKDAAFRTDGVAGADRAVSDYLKKIGEAGIETERVVSTSLENLSSNLTDSLANGKLDVSTFVSYTIKEILRLSVVQPFLKSLFSFASTGGGGGSIVSSLLGLFAADGAAFNQGGVRAFAKGDVFNSPQLFRFAQGGAMQTGVMGEAGPEAIMPLRRGRDGKLGVAAAAGDGGAAPVVNNTFNVGAGVTRGDVVSLMQSYGAQLKGEILGSIRNGGAFAR